MRPEWFAYPSLEIPSTSISSGRSALDTTPPHGQILCRSSRLWSSPGPQSRPNGRTGLGRDWVHRGWDDCRCRNAKMDSRDDERGGMGGVSSMGSVDQYTVVCARFERGASWVEGKAHGFIRITALSTFDRVSPSSIYRHVKGSVGHSVYVTTVMGLWKTIPNYRPILE
ncbi:hypothetical protein AG1IA_03031 [Rhizoctonia solani AG-1 IA]|uniref:Uncharacterized protein n=1 Tax=Thanatephorus cucumeris (strain AG1-IA) TaxID=983506 RepID=L8WY57_THACA|nr:hypothetical protein AG1IA_03031 [Rhizoctonia solani AG-1 IA]